MTPRISDLDFYMNLYDIIAYTRARQRSGKLIFKIYSCFVFIGVECSNVQGNFRLLD